MDKYNIKIKEINRYCRKRKLIYALLAILFLGLEIPAIFILPKYFPEESLYIWIGSIVIGGIGYLIFGGLFRGIRDYQEEQISLIEQKRTIDELDKMK